MERSIWALLDSSSTSTPAGQTHRCGRFGECSALETNSALRTHPTLPFYHLFRRIVYNNQIFSSVDELTDAYNSGSLQRGVKPDLKNQDWSTRKRMGEARALDDRATPHNVFFEGSRIKADKKAQYVEWMGWSFYLGFNR